MQKSLTRTSQRLILGLKLIYFKSIHFVNDFHYVLSNFILFCDVFSFKQSCNYLLLQFHNPLIF